jgi:FkbM family methyltransferase
MEPFIERIRKIRAAQQAGRSFDFESMLERHYRRFLRAGDTVIDIGAHTGRHLANFIECVGPSGHVIAFEPLPFAFQKLSSRFAGPTVVLKNVALTDSEGTVSFVHAQGTPEESGLRKRVYNNPEAAKPVTIEVTAEKLDRYVDAAAGLKYIKIDVEGGELSVLSGATRILEVHRPWVSVEYGHPGYSVYGHTLYTLFDFAQARDYAMFDIFGHRLGRTEWPMSCDAICWDFFMVPIEKVPLFETSVQPVPID